METLKTSKLGTIATDLVSEIDPALLQQLTSNLGGAGEGPGDLSALLGGDSGAALGTVLSKLTSRLKREVDAGTLRPEELISDAVGMVQTLTGANNLGGPSPPIRQDGAGPGGGGGDALSKLLAGLVSGLGSGPGAGGGGLEGLGGLGGLAAMAAPLLGSLGNLGAQRAPAGGQRGEARGARLERLRLQYGGGGAAEGTPLPPSRYGSARLAGGRR
jgi:hypothetical protein